MVLLETVISFILNVSSQSRMQPLDWSLMHDHITPVLSYNTPLPKRVVFKTAVLAWKCLNGTALR